MITNNTFTYKLFDFLDYTIHKRRENNLRPNPVLFLNLLDSKHRYEITIDRCSVFPIYKDSIHVYDEFNDEDLDFGFREFIGYLHEIALSFQDRLHNLDKCSVSELNKNYPYLLDNMDISNITTIADLNLYILEYFNNAFTDLNDVFEASIYFNEYEVVDYYHKANINTKKAILAYVGVKLRDAGFINFLNEIEEPDDIFIATALNFYNGLINKNDLVRTTADFIRIVNNDYEDYERLVTE